MHDLDTIHDMNKAASKEADDKKPPKIPPVKISVLFVIRLIIAIRRVIRKQLLKPKKDVLEKTHTPRVH